MNSFQEGPKVPGKFKASSTPSLGNGAGGGRATQKLPPVKPGPAGSGQADKRHAGRQGRVYIEPSAKMKTTILGNSARTAQIGGNIAHGRA